MSARLGLRGGVARARGRRSGLRTRSRTNRCARPALRDPSAQRGVGDPFEHAPGGDLEASQRRRLEDRVREDLRWTAAARASTGSGATRAPAERTDCAPPRAPRFRGASPRRSDNRQAPRRIRAQQVGVDLSLAPRREQLHAHLRPLSAVVESPLPSCSCRFVERALVLEDRGWHTLTVSSTWRTTTPPSRERRGSLRASRRRSSRLSRGRDAGGSRASR